MVKASRPVLKLCEFNPEDRCEQFSLRWNAGVHNFMTYVTGDIPVGAYNPARLSNIGIGHGALDGGVGYTYFDQQTGHEFSAVAGFTSHMPRVRGHWASKP
jgi:hypothetical protein